MTKRQSTTMVSATVEVLKKARRPLTVKEIWDRIEKDQLWRPPEGGKRPRATLRVQIARASKGFTGSRPFKTKLFRRLEDGKLGRHVRYELLT